MSNPVSAKWFYSTMSGAPTLSGTAGSLIGVLDSFLLSTGFGSVTLSSLVVASGVATATVNTGHGFFDHVVVLIGGSTPSGLNGDKRITKVSATVFTFDATGIADGAATGTITAKMSPMGWTKPFNGTNKAVYARTSAQATTMLLRVDDSPAQYPTLTMYESMSNVDTGIGPAPTSGSLYIGKSSAANSTARAWRAYVDDRAFYLFANADGSTWPAAMFFGDIIPYRSGDQYHCALIAHNTQSVSTSNLVFTNGTTTGAYLSRAYTQLGSAISCSRYSHRKTDYLGGGMATPNYVDNSIHGWPVEAWEGTTWPRGIMPGLECPLHDAALVEGTIIASGLKNKISQGTYNANQRALIDLTGPWR